MTAPEPEPPEVLSALVPVVATMLVGLADAVKALCVVSAGESELPPPHAANSMAEATAQAGKVMDFFSRYTVGLLRRVGQKNGNENRLMKALSNHVSALFFVNQYAVARGFP